MLTLSVLRCPDIAHPETRTLTAGEFAIGRGPDNDWVIPDPDRILSKRHCTVAYRAGAWEISDHSKNGTYLNQNAKPLDRGQPRALHDGDRLRFGPYEIEIRIEPDTTTEPKEPDPLEANRPFSAPLFTQAEAPDGSSQLTQQSVALGADYDPLVPEPDDRFLNLPVQPDHSPSVEDEFRPAPAIIHFLPDNWQEDPAPSPSIPSPPPSAHALTPPPVNVSGPPSMRAVAAPERDLLAAFLEGAALPDGRPTDPVATMQALGAAFRALVSGLRHALIARAEIKREFRIEETIIRARDNNPLKFSANDDDALLALLGGRGSDIGPAEAITDALRDMRLHELATIAAMQSAVRSLLAQFDPAHIAAETEPPRVFIPAQRKARAWAAFESRYARIARALADDFDSVFARAFVRAYEKTHAELSAHKFRAQERDP